MALTRTAWVALVLAAAASSCDAAFRIKHLGKGSSALKNVGIDSEPPTAGERGLAADDAGSDTFQKQAYDKRAASYDKNLKSSNYTVPDVIAHLCAQYGVPPSGRTLDFACGTGLVGDALVGAGFKALDGCDLSPASLEVIRTRKQGHYSDLKECNMNQFPYQYGDAEFDTIVFGGALNYAQSPYATLKELIRMTSPGGHIIYTYSYNSTSKDLKAMAEPKERLEKEGAWAQVHAETPAHYRDDKPHRSMRAFVMKVTKNTVTGNGKGGVFVDTSEVLADATNGTEVGKSEDLPNLRTRLETYLSKGQDADLVKALAKDAAESGWPHLRNQSNCMKSRSEYAAQKATKRGCKKVIEFGGFETPLSKMWAEMHEPPAQLYINIDPSAPVVNVQKDAEGHLAVQFPWTFQAYMKQGFQANFPELADPDCVVIIGICWASHADMPQFLTLFKHAHLVVVEAAQFKDRNSTGLAVVTNATNGAWGSATRVERKEFDCEADRPGLPYQKRTMLVFDRDA